jgi:acrylyl-CoA reductase (NADPH)
MSDYRALIVDREPDYHCILGTRPETALPAGEVEVDVEWSTLNYKDGLAITGKLPVVRGFPRVPGIDFSGRVRRSDVPGFAVGDAVLFNGWGLGEVRDGALAERVQVPSDQLQHLPSPFSARQAMALGTAGYTAALCLMALERHGITPQSGPVLVTGATGGVGSVAVMLLAARGYTVVASTGKASEHEWLRKLGASEIIDRAELTEPGKPLGKERWAAAIDSVGSHTLANVCGGLRYGGAVAACGLAQGMDFPASVAPFILRGIALLGVDSVYAPMARRIEAWNLLARSLDPALLDAEATELTLAEAIPAAARLLRGEVRGRVVVNVRA